MDKQPKDPREKFKYYLAHPDEMIIALRGSLVRGKQSASAIGVRKGDLRAITISSVERLRSETSDPAILKHLHNLRGVCKKGVSREEFCQFYHDHKTEIANLQGAITGCLGGHPPVGLVAAAAFCASNIAVEVFCKGACKPAPEVVAA